jgi:serine protease AprX
MTGMKRRSRRTAARVTFAAAALLTVLAGSAALPATAQAARVPGPAATRATLTAVPASMTWLWDGTATQLRSVAWTVTADGVWSAGRTGKGIGVALIDSGVTPVPGLNSGNVVNGPDLSFESQDPARRYLDTFGHGTHLAGIIAGRDTSGTDPFAGIAPDVKLTSVKVGIANGAVDVSQVIAAIDWVVEHRNDDPANPIRVINLAYGTDGVQDYRVDPLTHAVENAWRAGIVVVVAAGNGGVRAKLVNPAYDPYVVAVGAADTKNNTDHADDVIAPFSSGGDAARKVDVLAPGRSILSLRVPGSYLDTTYPTARSGTRFFRGSGTSQASAVVSGTVALMLQARPALTPDQVKKLLTSTATPMSGIRGAVDTGVGMLHAWHAFQVLAPAGAQTWTRSAGTGSLEKARGSVHVSAGQSELTGENDIFGAFSSRTWAAASSGGTAWTGGRWMGRDWTGAGWTVSAAGVPSWSGRAWSGRAWSGRAWSASTWSGMNWQGGRWS